MKKVAAIALLMLAGPLVSQTTYVGSNAASKSFDGLYEVAPECRNAMVYSTTLGPGNETTLAGVVDLGSSCPQ